MNEGTIFIVIRFPKPWPPHNEGEIFSSEQNGTRITLEATTGGCLVFLVADGQTELVKFKSQPIRIVDGGMAIFDVAWKLSKVEMRLNGMNVKSYHEAGNSELLVETKDHFIQEPPALAHPNAANNCQEWMEWRRNRYSNPKASTKKNRRLKTLDEQVAELRNAVASLIDLVALVQSGKQHLLGHLATELRALVYWNGKHYSPLLLRIAGRFNLPLPVYMLPDDSSNEPSILKEAQQRFRTNEPSLIKKLPNQKIVDIQEWLSSPIQNALINRGDSGKSSIQEDTINAKDLILDAATVLGSAHYDEDLPDHLEMLYRMNIFGTPALASFLLRTANLIVEISQFVLMNTTKST